MPEHEFSKYFQLFNEIGILEQLSRAMLEARLPTGLLASHFSVINHLIRVQDGRTPVELARAFQVAKTTMTHTLSGLEKHGFIEMRANPDDKRSKCVWLTDQGRAFRQNAIRGLEPDFHNLLDALSPEDIDATLPNLTKLRMFMDKARDKPS
ncbi:MarR family winged helix-turn-helix transcriptional regulator [Parasulfitobacter algicola]|uniref:MarR family transcriptional regulator n=1 Tax=Parasulfitobacter algicola TaxID=2614809 RepID=A0ABX2IKX4_9RHOB|nr:MarR family transcriptional regulator [Sulfitobacter algicola]NSX53494.1 MarR family transcriptional regulator [Sulfitobacter algicola]